MKLLSLFLLLISLNCFSQETETLSWDAADINGKLELTIARRDFEKIYKKPDSIVTPDYMKECGAYDGDTYQYYYSKGLRYELDNGIMNFRHIVFLPKSGNSFTHKEAIFNEATTLKDFTKFFPDAEKWEDSYFEKEKGLTARQVPSPASDDESLWIFYFKKDRLYAIRWFFPCYG